MKLCLAILISCFFMPWSFAQSRLDIRVDFQIEKATLAEALVKLSEVSGIAITFSNDILPSEKNISLNADNKSVGLLLRQMLDNTSVQFKVVGSQIVLFFKKPPPQFFRISGFIKEKNSGEDLPGAHIFDRRSGRGTSANEYGFYSLSLPEGNAELAVSYTGFKTKLQNVELKKTQTFHINLESNLTLEEIVIIAAPLSSSENPTLLSSNHLPIAQLNNFPPLGGERDIFRMAEFLPGVTTGADGLGGLHVRGGNADQNLVLMDGVPIYNPSHGLGIFSVFNSAAVKDVQLYKGIFPARYGGRLSSIMDVRTREGNEKEWTAHANVGMAASSIAVEGPLIKNKSSILVTGRRTFLDQIIQKKTRKIKAENEYFLENFGVALQGYSDYKFYDLNAKLNYSFSEKSKLYLSYYTGGDAFHDEDELQNVEEGQVTFSDLLIKDFEWGNEVAVLRWNYLINDQLFVNTTLTHSIFNYETRQSYELQVLFPVPNPPFDLSLYQQYNSELRDIGVRVDFDYSTKKNHQLKFGAGGTKHFFKPGVFADSVEIETQLLLQDNIDSLLNASKQELTEYQIYLEDEFFVGEKLKFNLGIHTDFVKTENRTYVLPQPRLSMNFLIDKTLDLKAGMSRMAQPLHLLTGSDLGLPNDLWVPSTDNVQPQESWQGIVGLNYHPKKQYEFSLEFYYKKMDNLLNYQGAFSLQVDLSNPSNFSPAAINSDNWEKQIIRGDGRSYGMEFQAQKKLGKLTGWLSYTFAFADRQFDGINESEHFRYRFDRRHDLKIVLNQKLTKWLDLSCNWIYGSGLPVGIPVGEYFDPVLDEVGIIYDQILLPANHRLDAGFNIHLKKKKLKHQIYLGVYNAYNRRNPQYIKIKSTPIGLNEKGMMEYRKDPVQGSFLPFLPSLSYSIQL